MRHPCSNAAPKSEIHTHTANLLCSHLYTFNKAANLYTFNKAVGMSPAKMVTLLPNLTCPTELAIKFMARPIPKVMLPMIFHEVKIQAALGEGHVNLVQVSRIS